MKQQQTLVEAVAKAIYKAHDQQVLGAPWESVAVSGNPLRRRQYVAMAEAAIRTVTAAQG